MEQGSEKCTVCKYSMIMDMQHLVMLGMMMQICYIKIIEGAV